MTLRIDVLTLFPAMLEGFLSESMLGRAREAKLLEIEDFFLAFVLHADARRLARHDELLEPIAIERREQQRSRPDESLQCFDVLAEVIVARAGTLR